MFTAEGGRQHCWKGEGKCLQQNGRGEVTVKRGSERGCVYNRRRKGNSVERGGGGVFTEEREGREEVFTVEQGKDQERGVYSRTGKGEVFTVERGKEREGVYIRTGKGERRRLQ